MEEIKIEKENSSPASEEETKDQNQDSKTDSTQDDSAELKIQQEKVKQLEDQLLQAGHTIEKLKREKKSSEHESPAVIDEELLDQKIAEGVEKALQAKQENDTRLVEAEENFKTLLAKRDKERDELIASLRSKQNRSGGSGDAGQKPAQKPDLRLTPEEEKFARAYNLTPEEIIKNR